MVSIDSRRSSLVAKLVAVLLALGGSSAVRAAEPGVTGTDLLGMLGMADTLDLGLGAADVPDFEAGETPVEPDGTAESLVGGPLLKAGKASWYGPGFHGRKTASGERYDQEALTCAMTGVALGTEVLVVRSDTGASVVLRVNDRGPYERQNGRWVPHSTRVVDLSARAMRELGGIGMGVIPVKVFRVE